MSQETVIHIKNQYSRKEAWRARAACHGINPNFFYPADKASIEAAKTFCQGCEVHDDCLAYALANEEIFGIWGGASERERKRILKRRKETADATCKK